MQTPIIKNALLASGGDRVAAAQDTRACVSMRPEDKTDGKKTLFEWNANAPE